MQITISLAKVKNAFVYESTKNSKGVTVQKLVPADALVPFWFTNDKSTIYLSHIGQTSTKVELDGLPVEILDDIIAGITSGSIVVAEMDVLNAEIERITGSAQKVEEPVVVEKQVVSADDVLAMQKLERVKNFASMPQQEIVEILGKETEDGEGVVSSSEFNDIDFLLAVIEFEKSQKKPRKALLTFLNERVDLLKKQSGIE